MTKEKAMERLASSGTRKIDGVEIYQDIQVKLRT